MKTVAALAATLMLFFSTPSHAGFSFNFLPSLITGRPSVTAEVSLAEQRMVLTVVDRAGLAKTFIWKVSTGRKGYRTPTGAWNPTWLRRP